MTGISSNDKDILDQFRKGAINTMPKNEHDALWHRIERSIGKSFVKRYLFHYRRVAAASVILFISIGYWWYNYNPTTIPTVLVVETPLKQRQKVILPDSTIVWLNAGSRLEYPGTFTDHRFVHLEGEAYFNVAHDKLRPFTVRTSGLNVIVLGTVFNVTAYKKDTEVVTTLVEGKVALQPDGEPSQQTTLAPNQQVTFHKDTKGLSFATVNPELFTSWVRGYYKFENTSFEQIAKQFERMYGIKIVFEDKLLHSLCFTGTFLQEQNIETNLEILQSIKNDFRYSIQPNQIIISQ